MRIWLYVLAGVCGLGSAFILAVWIAIMAPLGLWPVLGSIALYIAGAALASAFLAVTYDRLSREMMDWHIEQMKEQRSRIPEMMMQAFRDMQARGMIPEGVEFSIKEQVGNVEVSDPPPKPDKLN